MGFASVWIELINAPVSTARALRPVHWQHDRHKARPLFPAVICVLISASNRESSLTHDAACFRRMASAIAGIRLNCTTTWRLISVLPLTLRAQSHGFRRPARQPLRGYALRPRSCPSCVHQCPANVTFHTCDSAYCAPVSSLCIPDAGATRQEARCRLLAVCPPSSVYVNTPRHSRHPIKVNVCTAHIGEFGGGQHSVIPHPHFEPHDAASTESRSVSRGSRGTPR